ncbi:unnamed protein product, partial [Gongylonema pulchrum]|uniref:Clathrin_bdg domain-containing protein n=1 Tax=Gongylonema pulchrum TaxID=637853 RepID=A0A183E805_9BILA
MWNDVIGCHGHIRLRRAVPEAHPEKLLPERIHRPKSSGIKDTGDTKFHNSNASAEYDLYDYSGSEEYPENPRHIETKTFAPTTTTTTTTENQEKVQQATAEAQQSATKTATYPTLVLLDPEFPFQASFQNPFLIDTSLFTEVPPATEQTDSVAVASGATTAKPADSVFFNEVDDFSNSVSPASNGTKIEFSMDDAEKSQLTKNENSTNESILESKATSFSTEVNSTTTELPATEDTELRSVRVANSWVERGFSSTTQLSTADTVDSTLNSSAIEFSKGAALEMTLGNPADSSIELL